jgi:choline dehydrogenase-like flavoprotein
MGSTLEEDPPMQKFDVVVIGSGAGGAPIAHTLAQAGKSVLILEKGPLLRTQAQNPNGLSDFKRDELFATGPEKRLNVPGVANQGESYYSSHVEPDINDEPHVYVGRDRRDRATIEGYTAQVIGGGTQIYGAVSLRFAPMDFRLQSFNASRNDLVEDPNGDVEREARDWPIGYDHLERYYGQAERLIGINGTAANQAKPFSAEHYQTPLTPNPISRFVESGMDALSMPRYRTPLAVITQDHAPSGRVIPPGPEPAKTGYVNRYGDPLGLKSNTWVALLAPIVDRPNLTIRCNCVVTHLTQSNGRINGVHYRDPAGRPQRVEGDLVVVACSAIESVRLLMLSAEESQDFAGRIYRSGLLGKYFLTHCFGGAETVMPGRYDKSVSLDSDWATDFCASEDFVRANGLWAGGAMYNNTSDQALPISLARTHGSQDLDTIWKAFIEDTGLTGQALVDFFDRNFGTRLSVSFMANQLPLPSNRIELHPRVRDKWNRKAAYIIKDWHSHDIHLMNKLSKQCADILRFGGDNGGGNYPVEGFGGIYQAENARARIANHVMGGARFGSNPNDSVLDPDCRAWEFANLYVADGAFMPTSGSANPTLTIQANAFRVADRLLERL